MYTFTLFINTFFPTELDCLVMAVALISSEDPADRAF